MASSTITLRKNLSTSAGKRAGAGRQIFVCTMALLVLMYLLFLSSFFSKHESVGSANDVAAGKSTHVRSSSTISQAFKADDLDIEMAEFAYEQQKGERNPNSPVNKDFAQYQSNWPCFWGETAVGDLETWKTKFDQMRDGWKYVCGLSYITKPCVVYSLGSNNNMAFEKDLLRRAPHCEIHSFDSAFAPDLLSQWFTDDQIKSGKVKTHQMFISSKDDLSANPPHRSVPSIMAELGHTHVDILKMDIEGSEWGIFTPGSDLNLNVVGQIQLEVHTNMGDNQSVPKLFEYLEANGMRLFHRELNWRYGVDTCMEYAFIQKDWSPDKKKY